MLRAFISAAKRNRCFREAAKAFDKLPKRKNPIFPTPAGLGRISMLSKNLVMLRLHALTLTTLT
jgi:hypothetical protein